MTHRNPDREKAAKAAACFIRDQLDSFGKDPIGLVLGTGWGDCLPLVDAVALPFSEIDGFSGLAALAGHAREVIVAEVGGVPVVTLRGRVHLNEAPDDPRIFNMVRLQVEMLFHLGVTTLITTCAAGAVGHVYRVGNVAAISSFVTLHAPAMPLWAGEFVSPEDALDPHLERLAREEIDALELYGYHNASDVEARHMGAPGSRTERLTFMPRGEYVMLRGPFFEGRKRDKGLLLRDGANLAGMSTLPEACIAGLYGVKMLALAFVTNDDREVHSHEENVARAKASSAKLGTLLTNIVKRIAPAT